MSLRIAVLSIMFVVAAACASRGEVERPAVVSTSGDTISYNGSLDKAGVQEVARILSSKPGYRILEISSPGGELNLGMDLGEMVYRHGLDVRVTGWGCGSSCANYVFPAARNKSIEPGAVVVWHGSAIQEGIGGMWRLLKPMRTYLRDVKVRQAGFYERIGVDARVTILGQDLKCRCTWLLLPEDMAKFGIDSVHAPEDYGMPRPDWKEKGIRLIRLAEYPSYVATLQGVR